MKRKGCYEKKKSSYEKNGLTQINAVQLVLNAVS